MHCAEPDCLAAWPAPGTMFWAREDTRWMLHLGNAMSGREEKLPEVGKVNAEQKAYFWARAGLILVLFVSGVIIWHAYFGPATSISTQRVAVVVHSIAAVLAILGFIVCFDTVTREPGTLRATVNGTVTGGWGWKHHRTWLREVAAARRTKPGASASGHAPGVAFADQTEHQSLT